MLHIFYRPKTFEEIIGHKEIIKSLKSVLDQENKSHSFLFSGPSGCGKTTIARLVADYLKINKNDIIEINIANTGGIDFVRELNDASNYSPLFGDNRIYILDECQQLTKEGQNCILKLLEDTPKSTYLILCTTDPQKLLLTIRNRCISYTLKSLTDKEINKLIMFVAEKENIKLNEDLINLLVYKAEGCPRKALVNLNQIREVKDFDEATKLLADEIDEEGEVIELCRLLIKKSNWLDIVTVFNKIIIDPEQIRIIIAGYLASCLKKNQDIYYANMLELFVSSLTYGSQKSELILLLYKAWCL